MYKRIVLKSQILCHSERSEESIFLILKRTGFLTSFIMTFLESFKIFISFFFIFLMSEKAFPQEIQSDTLIPAIMDIRVSSSKFKKSEGRFITREVKVLNRGGSPMNVYKIEASCFCGTGKIIKPTVYPMEIGKLILNLNIDGFYEGSKAIEYYVYSNASNSPYTIKLYLEDEQDSLKTKVEK